MKFGKLAAMVPVCLAVAGFSGAAFAQSEGGTAGYYQGYTPNAKGCPSIHYVFRGPVTARVGYVWFSDASGVSKATGAGDPQTGKFQLTLKSLDGNGPTGTVEGVRDPHTGILTAELKGPGCSNLKLLPMAPQMEEPNG